MTKYTITETSDGFIIEEQCGENISPQTHKATAREVIARLMQIMNVGPVGPQIFPEEVCIGYVETAQGKQWHPCEKHGKDQTIGLDCEYCEIEADVERVQPDQDRRELR